MAKLLITSYSFNASAKTITFSGYESITLSSILLIVDVTLSQIIYNFASSTLNGTVSGNVLTLTGNGLPSNMSNGDALMIYYDDPNYDVLGTTQDANGNTLVSLGTALKDSIDSITSSPKGSTPVEIATSGVVSSVPCKVAGFFVNSTSSGTLKLWDNATAGSGTVLNNTISLSTVGFYPLANMQTVNGLYATIGGTLDVTFLLLPITL